MSTKICVICEKRKPLSAFPTRAVGSRDGHYNGCSECRAIRRELMRHLRTLAPRAGLSIVLRKTGASRYKYDAASRA